MNFVAGLLAACAGSSRERVNSPNLSAGDVAVDPANANASIVWFSSGSIHRNNLFFDTWLLFGSASDYELFVSGTGDTPTGTGLLNTWQNMGADLGYALAQSTIGSKSFTGAYSIRLVAGHGIVGSGSLSVNVNVVV